MSARGKAECKDDTRTPIIDDSPTLVVALKKHCAPPGFIAFEALGEKQELIMRAEIADLIFLDITKGQGGAALRSSSPESDAFRS